MVTILRKEGWVLNLDDKVVNGVLKMVERNNGECPCHNTGADKHCHAVTIEKIIYVIADYTLR